MSCMYIGNKRHRDSVTSEMSFILCCMKKQWGRYSKWQKITFFLDGQVKQKLIFCLFFFLENN